MATSTLTNSPHTASLAGYMGNAANTKRIQELDAAYAAGNKASRATQYAANGALAARKAKGYGRAALAQALGCPEKVVWHIEFYVPKGHPVLAAWLKAIAALAPANGTTANGTTAKPTTAKPGKPATRTPAKGSKPAPTVGDIL